MQRIAPNNQIPASNFFEVYTDGCSTNQEDFKRGTHAESPVYPIDLIEELLIETIKYGFKTIAIFRIRENKLPTKHKI